MFCSCHQTKSETAFLVFFYFLQDLKKWRKTIKVKWLGMYSAVLLQTMILWMIWWVLACIDCGKIGDVLPCTFFYMLIWFNGHYSCTYTHRLVSKLHPFPGMKHLDVAGGTGKQSIWCIMGIWYNFSTQNFFFRQMEKTLFTLCKFHCSMKLLLLSPLRCRHLSAGDVAFRVYDSINSVSQRALQHGSADGLENETKIYVCDINRNMLNIGKRRAIERGANASFLKPLGTVVFCIVD